MRFTTDHFDQYFADHESVWPEMQEALQKAGWHNCGCCPADTVVPHSARVLTGTRGLATASLSTYLGLCTRLIFAPRKDGFAVCFFETDGSYADAQARINAFPVSDKWEKAMARQQIQ